MTLEQAATYLRTCLLWNCEAPSVSLSSHRLIHSRVEITLKLTVTYQGTEMLPQSLCHQAGASVGEREEGCECGDPQYAFPVVSPNAYLIILSLGPCDKYAGRC